MGIATRLLLVALNALRCLGAAALLFGMLLLPGRLELLAAGVPITVLNYSTNCQVYATAIPLDAAGLWTQLGVPTYTPVAIQAATGGANLPCALGTNTNRPVIWLYVSLAPSTRLDLVAQPASQWFPLGSIVSATSSPVGANAVLRNGVACLTFDTSQNWQLGFSAAGSTNLNLLSKQGKTTFWVDDKDSGRISGDPTVLGLVPITSSPNPTNCVATVGADGSVTLSRSRPMTGMASNVVFGEDFTLVPGLPLLLCKLRWQNNGPSARYIAYYQDSISGTWNSGMVAPLFMYYGDPYTAYPNGTAWRPGPGTYQGAMQSPASGVGFGISTILRNNVQDGSIVFSMSGSSFNYNFVDPWIGQMPVLIPPNGGQVTNGFAFLLSQNNVPNFYDISSVQKTLAATVTNLFDPSGPQLPPLQSPCAVFVGSAAQWPQTTDRLNAATNLLVAGSNGVLQAAVQLDFTNHLAGTIVSSGSGTLLVQAQILGTNLPPVTLLSASVTGTTTNTVDLNQTLGWWTGVRPLLLTVSLGGGVALGNFSLSQYPPPAPVVLSPFSGASITDIATEFRWLPVAGISTYQLQLSQSPSFATTNWDWTLTPTPNSYFNFIPPDEALPAAGLWYWRIRSVDTYPTIAGDWSTGGSFAVNTIHSVQPLRRPVTPQKPLFPINAIGVHLPLQGYNPPIPADILPYTAVSFDVTLTAPFTNQMANLDAAPYRVVLGDGPALPDLEWAFQNYTNLIGITDGEGLARFSAASYGPQTRRTVMLCAKYGIYFSEADGIYKNQMHWQNLLDLQGPFMTNYGPYCIFAYKNNVNAAAYYSIGATMGLYLSGLCHAQGAFDDGGFYWNLAGFGTLNTCYGTRSGPGPQPDIWEPMVFVSGLSRGCAWFRCDTSPGQQAANNYKFNRYELPLLRAITRHSLVPDKTNLLKNIKLAIYDDVGLWNNSYASYTNYSLYGTVGPLFDATYGFSSMTNNGTVYGGEIYELFPNNGRYYWLPWNLQRNPSFLGLTNVALSRLQTTQAVAQVFSAAYPSNQWHAGDAMVTVVDDRFTVMNSWENFDRVQTYSIPLNHGPFLSVTGLVQVQSFVVGKREGTVNDESLWLYADAELTDRPTVLSVQCSRQPNWQVDPASAVNSAQWTNGLLQLNLSTVNFPAQVSLRANHLLTVTNGVGSGFYTNGTVASIRADTAPPGQVFDRWMIYSGSPSLAGNTTADTTLTMSAEDALVGALYRPGTGYALTVNDGTGGFGSYAAGTTVNIVASNIVGQMFSYWRVDAGNPVLANTNAANTTLTMPATAATVTAVYTLAPTYVLTVTNGTGGGSYYAGAVLNIGANIPAGWVFNKWSVNAGNPVINDYSASATTLVMPAADVTVTALLTALPLTVTTWTGAMGDFTDWSIWQQEVAPTYPAVTANIYYNSTVFLTNGEQISNLGTINLGNGGTGTLIVSNDSTCLQVTNGITVGNGSPGRLEVNGGLLDVSNTHNPITSKTSGSVLVINNGTVTNMAGGTGGLQWQSSNGSLVVTNGGLYCQSGAWFMLGKAMGNNNNTLYLGGTNAAGKKATVTVFGASNSGMNIGGQSSGCSGNVMTVEDGGLLTNCFVRIPGVTSGTQNGMVIAHGGQFLNNSANDSTLGGYSGANSNYVVVTGVDGTGHPALWDLGARALAVAGAASTNNWVQVDQGARVQNLSTLSVGNASLALNNSVRVANGGLVEFNAGITVGNAASSSNTVVAAAGGTLQFITAAPALAINNPAGGNAIVISNATLAYRGVSNLNVTNNWTAAGVGAIRWQGSNTLRLDNASATNGLGNSYWLSALRGATNYARLEMLNGTTKLTGAGLTLESTGALLVSNTTATLGGSVTNGGSMAVARASLTVSNNLVLQSGSALALTLSRGMSPSNDTVVVSNGLLSYGGTLTVSTNAGTAALAAGDTFVLFTAPVMKGAFSAVNLPVLAAGLAWDTSSLTNGLLKVVPAGMVPPVTSRMVLTGTNLTVVWSGATNAAFVLLSATNVALPRSAWLSVATNWFGPDGLTTNLLPVSPAEPQRFYLLSNLP